MSQENLDTVSGSRYHPGMGVKRCTRIRDALHRALGESGWSLKKLAETSGVAYSCTHGFFVRGTKSTLESAEQWCHALGLDVTPRSRKRKGR